MTREEMKAVDVCTVDQDKLKDIREIIVDETMPSEQRIKNYIEQVENPYCFRVGNVAVKVSFSDGGKSIEECLGHVLGSM